MNELVKIEQKLIGNDTVNAVDARELHAFLEVGAQYSIWIQRRIKEYGLVEHTDFVTINNSDYSPPRIDYIISLDMAKELSMVERNEKGRQARKYFIECERIAKGGDRSSRNVMPDVRVEFEAALGIAKLIGLSGNAAAIAADQATNTVTGKSALALIGQTHLLAEDQERILTPTQIGKIHCGGASGRSVNTLIKNAGLQFKDDAGWQPTTDGKPYAVLQDTGKKHKNGTPIQQLKWKESIAELLPTF